MNADAVLDGNLHRRLIYGKIVVCKALQNEKQVLFHVVGKLSLAGLWVVAYIAETAEVTAVDLEGASKVSKPDHVHLVVELVQELVMSEQRYFRDRILPQKELVSTEIGRRIRITIDFSRASLQLHLKNIRLNVVDLVLSTQLVLIYQVALETLTVVKVCFVVSGVLLNTVYV